MKNYDFIVCGAGFAGATAAHLLNKAGASVLVLEKENYVGGHSATEVRDDIVIHKYGPHEYHCNDIKSWEFVNRFGEFNNYQLRVKINYQDKLYSFPINLLTLSQIFERALTPEEAKRVIKDDCVLNDNPQNFEEAALATVGRKVYQLAFLGYTTKQWNCDPKLLPSSIFNRLPVRYNFNDGYFTKHADRYQGVPIKGYTPLVENMLKGIEVIKECDFLKDKDRWRSKCKKIIYTGPLDSYFDYSLGRLPYRSLKFDFQRHEVTDYQGGAIINYTSVDVPWTRITEFKHFDPWAPETNHTWIAKEYPASYEETGVPFYPINTEENNNLANKYKQLAQKEGIVIAGRLADYAYYDMSPTVLNSMSLVDKILTE